MKINQKLLKQSKLRLKRKANLFTKSEISFSFRIQTQILRYLFSKRSFSCWIE